MVMKFQKNKILILIVSCICLSFILFLFFEKNKLITESVNAEKTISNYEDYYKNKYLLEGKRVWDVMNLTKDDFSFIVNSHRISNNFIMILIDSVQCLSCLKHHIDKLKELRENNFTIVGISDNYDSFFKDINKIIIVNNSKGRFIKDYLPSFIVCFINLEGRIVYADFPSPNNYSQSNAFYEIIKRYSEN